MSSHTKTGIGVVAFVGVGVLSGVAGAYVIHAAQRTERGCAGQEEHDEYLAAERAAWSNRLDSLEEKFRKLSDRLERNSLEEQAQYRALVESTRDEFSSELAAIADQVREPKAQPESDAESAVALDVVGEFASYLDTTEAHVAQGALKAGASALFDQLKLDQTTRDAVSNMVEVFLERRIDDLRSMNAMFDRSHGRVDAAESATRLKNADDQLVTQLRTYLGDAQIQLLFPRIQSVISVPQHLVSSDANASTR